MKRKMEAFGRLLQIMDDLRAQCPWDRKQTMETLRNLTIEETYELADAILESDLEGVKEEIGDLMLHMIFYAKIAEEKGAFDIADALNMESEKLNKRHPHIYGALKVDGEEEVKRNWEQIKLSEGKKSVLAGVPESLPSLVKAYRMQEKTKQVGFEWRTSGEVWDKVEEELEECRLALIDKHSSQEERELEFGDLLFSLINFARYHGIEAESALARVNSKFKKRFEYIESKAPKSLDSMTLEEMDLLWEESKSKS